MLYSAIFISKISKLMISIRFDIYDRGSLIYTGQRDFIPSVPPLQMDPFSEFDPFSGGNPVPERVFFFLQVRDIICTFDQFRHTDSSRDHKFRFFRIQKRQGTLPVDQPIVIGPGQLIQDDEHRK